jgi:peptidyl-tRNA hydrolase
LLAHYLVIVDAPIQTTPAELAPASTVVVATALDQQIQKWKEQGLRPYAVTVKASDGEEITAYFKKADRNIIAYALTQAFGKKILEAGEFIMRNTFLAGDERLNLNGAGGDDDAIVAAAIEVAQKLEMLSAEVKKL